MRIPTVYRLGVARRQSLPLYNALGRMLIADDQRFARKYNGVNVQKTDPEERQAQRGHEDVQLGDLSEGRKAFLRRVAQDG